jgi:hypothetical protein
MSDTEAVRRAHDRAVAAAGLLEEPPNRVGSRPPAATVYRAAAAGHPWLQRLPFAPHAAATVEPSLLSCVRPPELAYVPAIPRRLAKAGCLSDLQLEALLAIGRCHTCWLEPRQAAPRHAARSRAASPTDGGWTPVSVSPNSRRAAASAASDAASACGVRVPQLEAGAGGGATAGFKWRLASVRSTGLRCTQKRRF